MIAHHLQFQAPSSSNDSPQYFRKMPTHQQSLLREQLVVLLQTESAYNVTYIPCQVETKQQRHVELEEWRRKICQWGYRVIDHLSVDRGVVAAGMNMFDRFLFRHNSDDVNKTGGTSSPCSCPSCKRMLDSRTYQLAAMTSLYLAIKLHTDCDDSRNKRAFKLDIFVELSRGQFVAADICAMEKTMLTVIRWQVHPPTPMIFCSYMLATLMPQNYNITHHDNSRVDLVLHVVRELSRYLTELAVCLGRECSGKPASQVACCAILSSMDLLTNTALPLTVRDSFYCRVFTVLEAPPDLELRAVLQKALWPELLFDENSDDARHPISMARDFGLLDMDRLYSSSPVTTPPVSPKRTTTCVHEDSPVSVVR